VKQGAYCTYENNSNNAATYGQLYNWFAVNDSRNIAPEGWHVSSDEEWKQLEMYLGMNQSEANGEDWFRGTDEGGKLKATGTREAGTGLWSSPNTGATNESGFSALPGGGCDGGNGSCWGMVALAIFWSSTANPAKDSAWIRQLNWDMSGVWRDGWSLKQCGFSVRCVKD
jgi:uncharacterized protein (TIGR02145 family)